MYLHNTTSSNLTQKDCTWRPTSEKQICPDPDIRFALYTSNTSARNVDYFQSDWLRQSGWDPNKEDVFIIHGYAGGDNTLPIVVLRDGKLKRNKQN